MVIGLFTKLLIVGFSRFMTIGKFSMARNNFMQTRHLKEYDKISGQHWNDLGSRDLHLLFDNKYQKLLIFILKTYYNIANCSKLCYCNLRQVRWQNALQKVCPIEFTTPDVANWHKDNAITYIVSTFFNIFFLSSIWGFFVKSTSLVSSWEINPRDLN